jgi:DNA-binding Lrp family transcriptional regulator
MKQWYNSTEGVSLLYLTSLESITYISMELFSYVESQDESIDIEIIRSLNWTGKDLSERPTYWQISKDIGVNPKIINNRLQKMREEGFMNGIDILLNTTFLGLERVGILCEIERGLTRDDENILRGFPFVYGIHVFNLDMKMAFIEIVYKVGGSFNEYLNMINDRIPDLIFLKYYSCTLKNITLDRKTVSLVQILYENAMMPVNDIARKMGLTSGKVKKILKRAASQGHIRFIASVSSYRNSFANLSEIFINVDEDRKNDVMAEISRKLGKSTVFEINEFEGLIIIGISLQNLSFSRELLEKFQLIPDVYDVKLFFPFRIQYPAPAMMMERITGITGMETIMMEDSLFVDFEERRRY